MDELRESVDDRPEEARSDRVRAGSADDHLPAGLWVLLNLGLESRAGRTAALTTLRIPVAEFSEEQRGEERFGLRSVRKYLLADRVFLGLVQLFPSPKSSGGEHRANCQ